MWEDKAAYNSGPDSEKTTIVVGLGNTLLGDDGVGIFAARRLSETVAESADIAEAENAGFDIIEILQGYHRAIIIDSIKLDGVEPGTVIKLRTDDIKTTPRLASFHDIDLVTALQLGRKLGLEMPREVIIYAVQGRDVLTMREGCLSEVEGIIPKLVEEVRGVIEGRNYQRVSVDISRKQTE